MQLRTQVVPTTAKYRPVVFVVGTLKDHRQYLDAGHFTAALFGEALRLRQQMLPVTAQTIHTTYLLLHNPWVPFGVQQHNSPTCKVEVKALATHNRLRNQDTRETIVAIEGQLQQPTRGRWRLSIHQPGKAAFTTTELFIESLNNSLPQPCRLAGVKYAVTILITLVALKRSLDDMLELCCPRHWRLFLRI